MQTLYQLCKHQSGHVDPGDHMTYCSCSSNCTYQNKARETEFMASWGYRVKMCSCDESLGPNISPSETFRWTESAFSGSNVTGLCYMLVLNFTTWGFVTDFVEAEVERRSHCWSLNNHSLPLAFSFSVPGAAQDHRAGDGTENEHTG